MGWKHEALREKHGEGGDALSFSRVTGALGAVGFTAFFVGLGFWVLIRIARDHEAIGPATESLSYFFFAAAAFFFPYAANQLATVLRGGGAVGLSGASGSQKAEKELETAVDALAESAAELKKAAETSNTSLNNLSIPEDENDATERPVTTAKSDAKALVEKADHIITASQKAMSEALAVLIAAAQARKAGSGAAEDNRIDELTKKMNALT